MVCRLVNATERSVPQSRNVNDRPRPLPQSPAVIGRTRRARVQALRLRWIGWPNLAPLCATNTLDANSREELLGDYPPDVRVSFGGFSPSNPRRTSPMRSTLSRLTLTHLRKHCSKIARAKRLGKNSVSDLETREWENTVIIENVRIGEASSSHVLPSDKLAPKMNISEHFWVAGATTPFEPC